MKWRTNGVAFALASCAVAWAAPVAGMTDAQGRACEIVLTLRGWHPPLALAGDASDAEAVSLLRRHLHWQRAFVTATQLAPQAAQTKDALWDAVRGFNLSGLYDRLPQQQEAWRSFTLAGALEGSKYPVETIDANAFEQPLDHLGDTTSQLAMRPRPPVKTGFGGDRYELRARLRANVGPILWPNVLRAGWSGLDHLTSTAPLPTPSSGGFFGGTGSDAEILLQLEPAYPAFFRWYLAIAEIPDVLAADSARSPAQHMHLVVRPDDGLQERYPQVADYLEQVKGFISAQVTIETDTGRWLYFDLDSVKQQLTVDAWVRDGHLVPSRNGRPILEGFDPDTPLDSLSYRSVVDLQLKALGVRMDLADWPIDWAYRRTSDGATYAGRITQTPEIDVGGAALGFIPTGLLDIAIPNNIAGIVEEFMRVLADSNDGDGAALDVSFAERGNHGSILSASAAGDTLDNFFVQFSVSLVNKRIIPNRKQFEGLKRLAADGIDALNTDLRGLKSAQQVKQDRGLAKLVEKCRAASRP